MADAGFLIDGTQYDVPSLDSLNMDEAQILYDTSGLVLEDFAVDEDDPEATGKLQKNLRNPGFIRALMIIAYLRGNGGVSRAKAEAIIGSSNLVSAIEAFVSSVGSDDGPPAASGDDTSSSPNGSSGSASESDSDAGVHPALATEGFAINEVVSSAAPEEIPEVTGTSESDMPRDKGRELLERGSRLT